MSALSGPLSCLSLLTTAQQAQWLEAFRLAGRAVAFHRGHTPVEANQALATKAPAFCLVQAPSVVALSGLPGCTHFPPVAVVLETPPTPSEQELLRRQGVSVVLVGAPGVELARALLQSVGQSGAWFKGIGRWAHLPDVLQFVASSNRAALVTVCGPHARALDRRPWASQEPPHQDSTSAWYGRIYIDNGQVLHAEVPGGATGDEAVAELLAVQDGVVRVLEAFLPPPRQETSRSVQGCLLNATYLMDEAARVSPPKPPTAPVKALPPEAPAAPTFEQLATELGLATLIHADRAGRVRAAAGAADDAELLAAVAAGCQQTAELLASWFGGTRAQSWGLSVGPLGLYCAETLGDDLLVAADRSTKTPGGIVRKVEQVARRVTD